MLSSTPTSFDFGFWILDFGLQKQTTALRPRFQSKIQNPKSKMGSGGLHQDHDEEHPDGGDDDGEAREGVAGAAAEGAGTAHAAKGPGEAASLAALNQHHQDEEQPHQQEQDVHHPDDPGGPLREAEDQSE